jgi:hypothetical protein
VGRRARSLTLRPFPLRPALGNGMGESCVFASYIWVSLCDYPVILWPPMMALLLAALVAISKGGAASNWTKVPGFFCHPGVDDSRLHKTWTGGIDGCVHLCTHACSHKSQHICNMADCGQWPARSQHRWLGAWAQGCICEECACAAYDTAYGCVSSTTWCSHFRELQSWLSQPRAMQLVCTHARTHTHKHTLTNTHSQTTVCFAGVSLSALLILHAAVQPSQMRGSRAASALRPKRTARTRVGCATMAASTGIRTSSRVRRFHFRGRQW